MVELFTDPDGRDWEVIDFRIVPPDDRKKRVPIGSPTADGRAFYRLDDVRLYHFGRVAYPDTSLRTLAEQFRNASSIRRAVARQGVLRGATPPWRPRISPQRTEIL
jgi:hypothetical protein